MEQKESALDKVGWIVIFVFAIFFVGIGLFAFFVIYGDWLFSSEIINLNSDEMTSFDWLLLAFIFHLFITIIILFKYYQYRRAAQCLKKSNEIEMHEHGIMELDENLVQDYKDFIEDKCNYNWRVKL